MKKIKKMKSELTIKEQCLTTNTLEKNNDTGEMAISVMLAKYASTQIELAGLSDEDQRIKLELAEQVVKILADSLGAKGLLQNMQIVQLLGIHELQQRLLPLANESIDSPEHNQYYVNAITKLSNVFLQQVNTLQKLQGNCQQKVAVEHLHVSNGGNAIIGQVTHIPGGPSEK